MSEKPKKPVRKKAGKKPSRLVKDQYGDPVLDREGRRRYKSLDTYEKQLVAYVEKEKAKDMEHQKAMQEYEKQMRGYEQKLARVQKLAEYTPGGNAKKKAGTPRMRVAS